MHLQDALGLIAFELLSVQPLLAWAFQPLPGVQGSLEPTILDAGFTPLESLEFIFRGGDWGQGMWTTGHRGSRGPCKYRFYSSLGLGRGNLLGNTGARGPGTFSEPKSRRERGPDPTTRSPPCLHKWQWILLAKFFLQTDSNNFSISVKF